jgi:mono/diheme cytochrome c family protein
MTGRGTPVWRGLQSGLAALGTLAVCAAPALAADAPAKSVTFTKDVAPIFQAKCQDCHQPNSIAPMSLISYQDARPWARSIRERVASRQMPPWHIDKSVGVQEFKNDMSLTDEQIDTIVKWVDSGAPMGDPKDMPAPKPLTTSNEWAGERDGYGPPDMVIKSDEYTMPAVHQDIWWRPMSDIPITEPRWVKMVEIRPTSLQARKTLHHSIAYLVLNNDPDAVNTGTGFAARGAGIDPNDLVNRRPQLMEWAIGKKYDLYPADSGKLLVPGEKISWDEHIHAAGEDIATGTEIGIWFYPKGQEPHHRSYLVAFSAIKDRAPGLDIRPNSISMSEGFTTLLKPAILENFQPHMHLRGKAMELEAILPDGSRQVVSFVRNFNFNWMTNYVYADDAAPAFPAGTVIHVIAWYDNTAGNRNNPDPNQWVGLGDRTVDEMGHAWVNVTYLSDQEYADWVKTHKKTESDSNQQ